MQFHNVKSIDCLYGIISPTRSSPIRLPVRERTYYDIETLLRSLFGSQWVDYAPLTPDLTRGDYAPCDLAAKIWYRKRPRDISRWAIIRHVHTQTQILLVTKSLSRESDIG